MPKSKRSTKVLFRDKNGRFTNKRPVIATILRNGKATKTLRGRDVLRQASLEVFPQRGTFDTNRSARESRMLINLASGNEIARVRAHLGSWQRLHNVTHDAIKGHTKGQEFKVSVKFRGQWMVGTATRDGVLPLVLSLLGSSRLTAIERARLWTGPSGKTAVAQALGMGSTEGVADNWTDRQKQLDASGIKRIPFEVRIRV